jgi:DNA-binding MarR family transcriptional regulator
MKCRPGEPGAADSTGLPTLIKRYPTYIMSRVTQDLLRRLYARPEMLKPERGRPETLRFPHFAALAALEEFGPMSQKELGEHIGIDSSEVVGFIDSLEEIGLVLRERHKGDRRRNALVITEAGREACSAKAILAERWTREFFAPLDEAEIESLRDMLLRTLDYRLKLRRESEPKAAEEQESPLH